MNATLTALAAALTAARVENNGRLALIAAAIDAERHTGITTLFHSRAAGVWTSWHASAAAALSHADENGGIDSDDTTVTFSPA